MLLLPGIVYLHFGRCCFDGKGIATFEVLTLSRLVIVFQCPVMSEQTVIDFVNTHYLPKRLTLLLYIVDPLHPHFNHFQVNLLRNLAIRNIVTSHFLVLDMDLRLSSRLMIAFSYSGNTYSSLHSLSSSLQNSTRAAVILPIFFFNHTSILQWCDSVEDCAALFILPASLTSRSIHYQPETKAELIACLYTKNCFSNKRLVRTHVGHLPYIDR